ncbi:CGNR zinc finger domain-containing protein [Micromonospora zamorensis]
MSNRLPAVAPVTEAWRRWCSMAGCGNYIKMKRAYAVRAPLV